MTPRPPAGVAGGGRGAVLFPGRGAVAARAGRVGALGGRRWRRLRSGGDGPPGRPVVRLLPPADGRYRRRRRHAADRLLPAHPTRRARLLLKGTAGSCGRAVAAAGTVYVSETISLRVYLFFPKYTATHY